MAVSTGITIEDEDRGIRSQVVSGQLHTVEVPALGYSQCWIDGKQVYPDSVELVSNSNPNHDEQGKFSSAEQAISTVRALPKNARGYIQNPLASKNADDEQDLMSHWSAFDTSTPIPSNAPIIDVPLDLIDTDESAISAIKVEWNIRNPEKIKPGVALSGGGRYYLLDGNHRAIARYHTGDKTVKLRVSPARVDDTFNAYNPQEARDEIGRWTVGGESRASHTAGSIKTRKLGSDGKPQNDQSHAYDPRKASADPSQHQLTDHVAEHGRIISQLIQRAKQRNVDQEQLISDVHDSWHKAAKAVPERERHAVGEQLSAISQASTPEEHKSLFGQLVRTFGHMTKSAFMATASAVGDFGKQVLKSAAQSVGRKVGALAKGIIVHAAGIAAGGAIIAASAFFPPALLAGGMGLGAGVGAGFLTTTLATLGSVAIGGSIGKHLITKTARRAGNILGEEFGDETDRALLKSPGMQKHRRDEESFWHRSTGNAEAALPELIENFDFDDFAHCLRPDVDELLGNILGFWRGKGNPYHDAHSGQFTHADGDNNPARQDYSDLKRRTREAILASGEFRSWFHGSKVVDEAGDPKETAHGTINNPGAGGKPLVVFHGTASGQIPEFRKDKIAEPEGLHFGPGFYFTEDIEAAEHFAKTQHGEDNPTVMRVYLAIKRPFDVDHDTIHTSDLTEGYRKDIKARVVREAYEQGGREEAHDAAAEFDRDGLDLHYRDMVSLRGAHGSDDRSLGLSKQYVNDLIQSKDYDGMVVQAHTSMSAAGTNDKWWIAFEPTQIKSTEASKFDPSDPIVTHSNPNHDKRGRFANRPDVSPKTMGYDLGGLEGPYDSDYENPTMTLVDIWSIPKFAEEMELEPEEEEALRESDYQRVDLSKGNWDLPEKEFVNVGQVLRHLEGKKAYTRGRRWTEAPVNRTIYSTFATEVNKCLLPGGVVRLYDFKPLVDEVGKHLLALGYTNLDRVDRTEVESSKGAGGWESENYATLEAKFRKPGTRIENKFHSDAQRRAFFAKLEAEKHGGIDERKARTEWMPDKREVGKTSRIKDEHRVPPPPGRSYEPDVEERGPNGVTVAARVGVPAMSTPPPPPIPPLPNLTPHERAAESSFREAFHEDPDGMASMYYDDVLRAGGIPTFNTDEAKMLHAAWKVEDLKIRSMNRATLNNALHGTANAIAKRAFLKHLDTLKDGDQVMVTVGGCGAGKGYALKNVPYALEVKNRCKAVWDSAGDQNATENPWVQRECEKRGLIANYIYVHADPYSQWSDPDRGVVKRAGDPSDGRMVDAKVFADSYAIGTKNHQAFFDAQQHNPFARFLFLTNQGKPEMVESIPAKDLKINRHDLASYAIKTVMESNAPAHVKRGATTGVRIWKES